MTIDYRKIKAENETRYGTDVKRYGNDLLANRYDNRSHFIYELLQNAEDAMGRRTTSATQRSVSFQLDSSTLIVSHFGEPFSERDVQSICGIAASSKADDVTAIGRFGIGFKSVYAFTDLPEIHSGDAHFSIESFVWPEAIPAMMTKVNETVIVLPLNQRKETAVSEITNGLKKLGLRSLLFLRQINEVWT